MVCLDHLNPTFAKFATNLSCLMERHLVSAPDSAARKDAINLPKFRNAEDQAKPVIVQSAKSRLNSVRPLPKLSKMWVRIAPKSACISVSPMARAHVRFAEHISKLSTVLRNGSARRNAERKDEKAVKTYPANCAEQSSICRLHAWKMLNIISAAWNMRTNGRAEIR